MSTSVASISPVHGGLTAPVDRFVTADQAEAFQQLFPIAVNEVDRTTLYRIADGTLSPLEGPMGEADYNMCLDKGAIERNGKAWAWTIPIVLPVTEAEAQSRMASHVIGHNDGGSLANEEPDTYMRSR